MELNQPGKSKVSTTDMEDVAAGAEASRRAAWAKYYEVRDALAYVVAQELRVAVFGDSARFVWHANNTLGSIDERVNLESMAAQIAKTMVSESTEGLTVPGVVDWSEASARALIAAWRRGHNVHGRGGRPTMYDGWSDLDQPWTAFVDKVDRTNPQ